MRTRWAYLRYDPSLAHRSWILGYAGLGLGLEISNKQTKLITIVTSHQEWLTSGTQTHFQVTFCFLKKFRESAVASSIPIKLSIALERTFTYFCTCSGIFSVYDHWQDLLCCWSQKEDRMKHNCNFNKILQWYGKGHHFINLRETRYYLVCRLNVYLIHVNAHLKTEVEIALLVDGVHPNGALRISHTKNDVWSLTLFEGPEGINQNGSERLMECQPATDSDRFAPVTIFYSALHKPFQAGFGRFEKAIFGAQALFLCSSGLIIVKSDLQRSLRFLIIGRVSCVAYYLLNYVTVLQALRLYNLKCRYYRCLPSIFLVTTPMDAR